MDAIRLRQIYGAFGLDKHMHAMVLSIEKKRVAQRIREMPRDDYAMIYAQKLMDVNAAANAMQLMLGAKLGNVSVMTHHGVNVDNTQFAYAANTCGRWRRWCQKYSEISAPHVCQRRDLAATTHPEAGAGAASSRRHHQERRQQGNQQHC
ncbi:MAG: hypothetical protein ACKPKO_63990, partial [Candidatus Fonsibacter sp.]